MAGGQKVDAATIGELSLFVSLAEDEKEALARMATLEERPAGTMLFQENDPPGDLYVLLSGRVTLCMRMEGRSEACFLSLRSGELLGWSALLRRRRVATARIVERSRLVRLPASELLELCEKDHHVGYALMSRAFEELADRLHDTRLQLLDMFGATGT